MPRQISKYICRELMTEKVFFIKYWWMREQFVSRKRGGFLIQGKRGGAWAPLGVHLCTCLHDVIISVLCRRIGTFDAACHLPHLPQRNTWIICPFSKCTKKNLRRPKGRWSDWRDCTTTWTSLTPSTPASCRATWALLHCRSEDLKKHVLKKDIHLLYCKHSLSPLALCTSPAEVQAGLCKGALQVPPVHGHAGGVPRQEGPVAGQRPGLQAHAAPVHLAARWHEGAGGQEGVRSAERGEADVLRSSICNDSFWSHDIYCSVHPGEGSSSVLSWRVLHLFFPVKGCLGVVPDPMWGQRSGMSMCTDCKALWDTFVICENGLYI